MRRKINSLFLFAKMFPKMLFIPKSVTQSIYAYSNRKNKSCQCFNIGLVIKNKSRKTIFLLLIRKNKSRNNLSETN